MSSKKPSKKNNIRNLSTRWLDVIESGIDGSWIDGEIDIPLLDSCDVGYLQGVIEANPKLERTIGAVIEQMHFNIEIANKES